jgi:hypothetical protein
MQTYYDFFSFFVTIQSFLLIFHNAISKNNINLDKDMPFETEKFITCQRFED